MVGGLDDMRISPKNLATMLDVSYEYGKLFAKHPSKRDNIRDRWELFCETYAPSFEIAEMMRMRFNEGCFANYWR
jgi:hypothetical protein